MSKMKKGEKISLKVMFPRYLELFIIYLESWCCISKHNRLSIFSRVSQKYRHPNLPLPTPITEALKAIPVSIGGCRWLFFFGMFWVGGRYDTRLIQLFYFLLKLKRIADLNILCKDILFYFPLGSFVRTCIVIYDKLIQGI